MAKTYYVYIMTNKWNRVLYTGMTNDIARRVREHKAKQHEGFTHHYQVKKLVYIETFGEVRDAIVREKQIKKGSRKKKIDLIEAQNPTWRDLGEDLW